MRVETIKQATSQSDDFTRQPDAEADTAHEPASRALVVTAPASMTAAYRPHRQAAFLAHLIATKEQAPQTRERRRAQPDEAISAYRAAARLA